MQQQGVALIEEVIALVRLDWALSGNTEIEMWSDLFPWQERESSPG